MRSMTPLRFASVSRASLVVALSFGTACNDVQPLTAVAPNQTPTSVAPFATRTVVAYVVGDEVVLVNEGVSPVRVRLTDAREMPGAESAPCGTECPAIFPGQTLRVATSTVRGFNASTIEVAVLWWTFHADGVMRRQGDASSAIVSVLSQ
jgi:hypothetical protein